MSATIYLEAARLYEVIPTRRRGRIEEGVAFSGTPRRHPYDSGKVLLVPDHWNEPSRRAGTLLEFRIEDILQVDDLPSPVSVNGEGLPMVRLWVRRGAMAVELHPFEVGTGPGA